MISGKKEEHLLIIRIEFWRRSLILEVVIHAKYLKKKVQWYLYFMERVRSSHSEML